MYLTSSITTQRRYAVWYVHRHRRRRLDHTIYWAKGWLPSRDAGAASSPGQSTEKPRR